MKLYEVNAQIMEPLDQLEPDPETGEVPSDEQEAAIIAQINALAMKREDILQYLRNANVESQFHTRYFAHANLQRSIAASIFC